jgi:hypothetical protein
MNIEGSAFRSIRRAHAIFDAGPACLTSNT